MLGAQRNDNRVISGRGLELEIERSTKTFSQRQAPGAIDSVAEWRMQDKLHSARFIEEPLHHQSLLGRNCAKRAISVPEIIGDLLRSFGGQLDFTGEPLCNGFAFA